MRHGVIAEHVGFQFNVLKPALYHVADRYDAAQDAVVGHRHMADAVEGHQTHDIADFRIGLAGEHIARHQRRDGQVDDGGAVFGEALHDVALRKDSLDAEALASDDDGADALKAQPVGGGADAGVGRNGDDLVALVIENALYAHGTPRRLGSWIIRLPGRHFHGWNFPRKVSLSSRQYRRTIMPRGEKSKYTDKQERKADHIAEGYEKKGVSKKEAESRAWATVNKDDGGGKNPGGSGRKGARKS